MDNLLLLTLLLVFLTALVGAYVSRRLKERVLKDFDAYHVTMERDDGGLVWGQLKVYANGIELLFASPHRTGSDRLPLEKTSYIVPQPHLANVRSIWRYHDELTPANQQRRRVDIEKTYRPGFFRRTRRSIRNFLNTFRDAINESVGLLLLRMKTTSESTLLQTQDQRLQRIGQEALGTVNNAYDPILEHYIGRRVVVERQGAEHDEIGGILKEYSPDWLLLLDCRVFQEIGLAFDTPDRFRLQRDLDFLIVLRQGREASHPVEMYLEIDNHGTEAVWIDRLEGEDYLRPVERQLKPGESIDVTITDLPDTVADGHDFSNGPREWQLIAPERAGEEELRPVEAIDGGLSELKLVIQAVREVDVCLPRTRALVRHGGEKI